MNVRVRGKELHTRGHQRFMGTGAAKRNPATEASIQTSLSAVKGTEEAGQPIQKKTPKKKTPEIAKLQNRTITAKP